MDTIFDGFGTGAATMDVAYDDTLPFSVSPVRTEYTASANSGVEDYTEGDFQNHMLHLSSADTNPAIASTVAKDDAQEGADFDIGKFLVFNSDDKSDAAEKDPKLEPAVGEKPFLAPSSSATHVSRPSKNAVDMDRAIASFVTSRRPCASPVSMVNQGKSGGRTLLKDEKDSDGDMDTPLVGRGSSTGGKKYVRTFGKKGLPAIKKKKGRKVGSKGKKAACAMKPLPSVCAAASSAAAAAKALQFPACLPDSVHSDAPPPFVEALTDEAILALKPKKNRKKAKFDKPSPSRFCHICSRTPKNVRLAVCRRINDGICRKVVCEKCFEDYGFGHFDGAYNTSNWLCAHCSGLCPERAQCQTYGRINDKLRATRLKQLKVARSLGLPSLSASPTQSQHPEIQIDHASLALHGFFPEYESIALSSATAFPGVNTAQMEPGVRKDARQPQLVNHNENDGNYASAVSKEQPLQVNLHPALSLQALLGRDDVTRPSGFNATSPFLDEMSKFLPGISIPSGAIGKMTAVPVKPKERRGRKPGSGKKKKVSGGGPPRSKVGLGKMRGVKNMTSSAGPKESVLKGGGQTIVGTAGVDVSMPYDLMLAGDDVFSHDFVGLGEEANDPLQDRMLSGTYPNEGTEDMSMAMINF